MLSANDREQVMRWSQRQLGNRSGMVSITEGIRREALNTVEKDGTGIGNGFDKGCRPVMSIMANLTQDVYGEQGSSASHDALLPESHMGIASPTWH